MLASTKIQDRGTNVSKFVLRLNEMINNTKNLEKPLTWIKIRRN